MPELTRNITNNGECSVNDILKNAVASTSKSISRVSEEVGVMSIIKAKTSNKLTISKNLLEKLANPDKVQISYTNEFIIIGERLPNNNSSFNIKRSGNKGTIYSTELVKEIVNFCELDFSKNRTSITFSKVEYTLNEEYPVAVVKVK